MNKKDPLHDIELLVRSRHGLIVIDTAEEERAELLLRHLADRVRLPLLVWSRTRGLRRDAAAQGVYGTTDAQQALAHVGTSHVDAIYHFQSLGSLRFELIHQPVRLVYPKGRAELRFAVPPTAQRRIEHALQRIAAVA